MIKTIFLLALISLAMTQQVDVNAAVDQAGALTDAATAVANGVTVGQVVNDPVGTAQAVTGQSSVDVDALPTLSSVTVGWGDQGVVFTPADPNPTNSDWLNNGEQLDVERANLDYADGEWTLNWSVEDGNDWALWNNNGDLVIVDWQNGEWNTVADLGNNDLVNAEIASGAEQIVDYVWSTDADSINTSDVVPILDNIVNQVWNNANIQNFLAANSGASLATAAGEAAAIAGTDTQGAIDAATGAVSDPQAIVDVAQGAVNDPQAVVDAANNAAAAAGSR